MSLLWLPAASPLFLYSPSSLIADNLQGSWTGTIPQGQPSGAGNHSATVLQHSGAVLLPSIYSSGFSPVFSPQTGWTVNLTVNSDSPQSWAPGQTWTGSKIDPNNFLLQFECTSGDCSSTPITFGGATVSTQYAPDGQQAGQAQLDDAQPGPTYTGDFTEIASSGQNSAVSVTADDQGGTLSWTGTAGASVSVTFQGTAIAAYGVVGPSLGSFEVTLDGNLVSTLSARFDAEVHNVPLFFNTLLDSSAQHTLVLEAMEGGGGVQVGLVIDSWQARGLQGQTSFSANAIPPASTPVSPAAAVPPAGPLTNGTATPPPPGPAVDNSGPNTGAIVGGVIGGLAGLALLYLMFRQVHKALKPDEKKVNPWDDANMLQNVKNEGVHVTTVANQRYVYPGMIAHSKLKA